MAEFQEPLAGRWRIEEMEAWDQEFVDLVEPGYFEFGADGSAEFQFGCVFGTFRWTQGRAAAEAGWFGNDEMDPASGRIDACVDGSRLVGTISTEGGEVSEFSARRWTASDSPA